MTYIVFGGTLSLAQSTCNAKITVCIVSTFTFHSHKKTTTST